MPLSALPEHLRKDPFAEGDGTDHDNKAQKWWSRGWTAWGPNANDGESDWLTLCGIPFTKYRICLPIKLPAKWRRFPILLVGYNVTRWMAKNDAGGEKRVWALADRWVFWERETFWTNPDTGEKTQIGVSPIQKGARISFHITWPLGFHFRLMFKWRGKVKMIYIRIGSRWDSGDDYHVCPAVFVGGNDN